MLVFEIHGLQHCLELTYILNLDVFEWKNGFTEANSNDVLYFLKLKYVPVI